MIRLSHPAEEFSVGHPVSVDNDNDNDKDNDKDVV